MAVPAYTTDLNDIYIDTGNFSTVGGGRVTDVETDDYIQGNNCWSHDPFGYGIEGGMQNSTETVAAGDAVYIWWKCDVAATLATHAAGGVQLITGSSTTAYDCYYVLGSDDYQYGGWKCSLFDPTITPSTTIGSPTSTSWFGVRWNVPAGGAAKGYPMKIDAMRHGRQIEVTAGEVANPATWSALSTYDSVSTRQWGICQPNDAGAEIQGLIYFGTATTAAHFDDASGETIIIIDTEWTSTDFTQIIIDHASTVFNLDGATIKALGTNNPGRLIFNNASTVSALKNNVFASIGITTLRAGVTSTGNKWTKTDTVTQNGATIDSCTFDKLAATSSLVVDDLDLVTDSTFISDGSNHAIDLGTIATNTSVDCKNFFTNYASSDGSTGNEAILVNVNTSQTLTISVPSGYNTPSVYNTGSGNVVKVISPVTTQITVKDITTGSPIEGAIVLAYVTDNTNYFYQATPTSITGTGTTATVTQTAHGLVTGDYVIVSGVTNDDDYNGVFSVTVTGASTYTYTTTETLGVTPATGTPRTTMTILSGTTNASGIISDTRTFSANQEILGWVRKHSSAPYYQQGSIVATVNKDTGSNLTIQLIRDE